MIRTRELSKFTRKQSKNLDVRDIKTWPPGSLMLYYVKDLHTGIGIVVFNDGAQIGVIWDNKSNVQYSLYNVEKLNSETVFAI